MVLLADAVVLHHRAALPDGPAMTGAGPVSPGPRSALSPTSRCFMARLLLVAAGLVIVLGTVVTSSGPHGGDPKAKRFPFALHDVARLHSLAVWLFLGLPSSPCGASSAAAPRPAIMRRGETLLVLIVAQGALGYLQYFTGVPAALVAIHIAMATVVWTATCSSAQPVPPARG